MAGVTGAMHCLEVDHEDEEGQKRHEQYIDDAGTSAR
jgi:hypothetical protein